MPARIIRALNGVLVAIGQISLFGTLLLVSADVGMRYLFNKPIAGTLEISQLTPVIVTFCFFAYTAMEGRHIRTTFVTDRLSPRWRLVFEKFAELLMLIFVGILIWRTSLEAWRSLQILEYAQGIIPIPRYPIKILIPVALAVGWLYYLARFFTAKAPTESAQQSGL